MRTPTEHTRTPAAERHALRAVFASALFFGSYLLFVVQPVEAKQLLPWFGGAANVWTSCLVFFQVTLLLGYALAHLVEHHIALRWRFWVLACAVALACVSLPIIPAAHWKPAGSGSPSWRVLGALAATVGLPYLLICSTSPLIQSWFARCFPDRSAYRLFALSNLASLLALISYPVLVEPWIGVRLQSRLWSLCYGLWALLLLSCARAVRLAAPPEERAAAVQRADLERGEEVDSPLRLTQYLGWAGLAALGSILLVAVTSHLTRDVAAAPLLWIGPLAIYLGTFILSFQSNRRLSHARLTVLGAAALAIYCAHTIYSEWPGSEDHTSPIGVQITVYCIVLAAACLFCHGRLALTRPGTKHLTRFYLTVSAGGAAGSILIGLAAPSLLPADFDLELGMVLCALAVVLHARARVRSAGFAAAAVGAVATLCAAGLVIQQFYDQTLLATRNFYGALRVYEGNEGHSGPAHFLSNGVILHGMQFLRPPARRRPTEYYGESTGVGLAIASLRDAGSPLRIGVIGLGAGTLAAYGRAGDVIRFYELNPAVVQIARSEFTYLEDSPARVEVALGDARLSLEREPPEAFDLLAIDAFSSDSIPVHLLTREALTVYLRHLKPGGVIAFHTSNRYLDLPPLVATLARERGLLARLVESDADDDFNTPSSWVLVSRRSSFFESSEIKAAAGPIAAGAAVAWTDDFSDLLRVMWFWHSG